MRLGGGPGGGEITTGDGVRDKGLCGDGVRTWYEGEAERERGPKVFSKGTSSS
jgi:hypothetical protein